MLQGVEGRKGGRKRGAEDSGVNESFESTPAGLTHTILPLPNSSFLLFLLSLLLQHSTKKNTPRGQKFTGQTSFLLSSPLDSVCWALAGLSQPISLVGSDVAERRPHFLLFPRAKAPCGGSRRPQRAKLRTPNTPAVASLIANRSDVTLSSDKPGSNPADRLPVAPANDSNCDVACRSTDTVKTEGVFVCLF